MHNAHTHRPAKGTVGLGTALRISLKNNKKKRKMATFQTSRPTNGKRGNILPLNPELAGEKVRFRLTSISGYVCYKTKADVEEYFPVGTGDILNPDNTVKSVCSGAFTVASVEPTPGSIYILQMGNVTQAAGKSYSTQNNSVLCTAN